VRSGLSRTRQLLRSIPAPRPYLDTSLGILSSQFQACHGLDGWRLIAYKNGSAVRLVPFSISII
jgi:hypothetical protein